MMTLEQIDDDLADWDAKLQRASDNLMELTRLTAYQRLRGEGGWPKSQVCGATAARVAPALAGLEILWSHYSLFTDAVRRAQALRGSVSLLLPSRHTLHEIEQLLRGPSIKLPAVATPLQQRGLLTASQVLESVTPEQLLVDMHQRFQQARDAIVAVDAAWDRLPTILADFETEMTALETLATSLGTNAGLELADVRQRLTALRDLGESDPLTAVERCDEMATVVRAQRSRLAAQGQERDAVRAELRTARGLLARLVTVHEQACQTWSERELKVQVDTTTALPKPVDETLMAALEPWLAKLEVTATEGKWRPARVGLARWTATAQQYLATSEAARQGCEALLHERRDLRGLLEALKAKAAARGQSEDAELAALASEAWGLLHARPTPLARARQLVAEYQRRLL